MRQLVLGLLLGAVGCLATHSVTAAAEPVLIARPDAFKTLVNPPCSYCVTEARRRAGELKPGEPVLSWTRFAHEGGAIQYRFFLEPYRVISDTYGVFVYDPDAGYARGFKRSLDFTFHGCCNGVMVMKHKDGTLFSCLSGRAFACPRKGQRLQAIPTITTKGIEGRAQAGPLKGRTLRWVDSVQCHWFAWSAEYPDTELHAAAAAEGKKAAASK